MSQHDRHWIINFGILLLCFKIAKTQNAPHIPCPDIFKYMNSGGNYIGLVTLNKLPLRTLTVEVEFSQRESITSTYYGSLSLSDNLQSTQANLESGRPVTYRVDFPNPRIFPKLIGIKVNGDSVCRGQGLGAPSTTFKLQHTFYPAEPTTFSRPVNTNSNRNQNKGNQFVYTVLEPTTSVVTLRPVMSNRVTGSSSFSPDNPFIQQFLNNQIPTHTTVFQIPLTPSQGPPQTIPVHRPPVNIPVNKPPQTIPVNTPPASTPVNRPSSQSGNVGCGREGLTPFVVQGNDFPRGKFPWLAAIYLRDSADLKFTCGGSLISSRTVITAAHCFPTRNFSPDLISVYLGRHNLFISEDGSQQRDVASLTMHPNYNISAISDADIALLHFTVEVTFSQYIRPVCLWTQSAELMFIEQQKGFIAGWGSDNNGNAVTSVAKMVEARIVSEADCLRSSDLFRILTSSRSLCAGNRDGSGPCIGDSGGGLMLNVFGVWTLRGILSVGKTVQRNCDLNEFVVYCDVAKHMSWVRQNMN